MTLNSQRFEDIISFYNILNELEEIIQGKINLSQCTGSHHWPQKGVYFFFETNQKRTDSGTSLRVTRIGTHALLKGAKTTLWNRLSRHKGSVKSGGGNHRGSIFRLLVGAAIMSKKKLKYISWGKGSSSSKEVRESEIPLEKLVSQYIREMPFIYLEIPDEAGPDSLRGYIERNSISLLSNYEKAPIDLASNKWLGNSCDREKVKMSGLWNQNHVDETYDPNLIKTIKDLVCAMVEE
jgi:hypothetical protein